MLFSLGYRQAATANITVPRANGKNRFRVMQEIMAAALLALLFCPVLASQALAQKQLLKNGDLEQVDTDSSSVGKTAHWTGYRWEGQGDIRPVTPAVHGKRAIMIEGSGPSKQAIYQEITLPACHYRLSAMVAGQGLRPNHWQQSAAVYISFASGGDLFQKVFRGNSNWRRMELNFQVKTPTKVLVYFFNYGSGRFFVDDIVLTARKGCRPAKQAFKIASKEIARLDYKQPLTHGDLALQGYCTDRKYARRTLCKRLKKSDTAHLQRRRASRPRPVVDFSRYRSVMTDGWSPVKMHGGRDAARIQPGKYMEITPDRGMPQDWSGFDWLSFTANNPSGKPQKVNVEIHDSQSSGYWSRVNHYTMLPPGKSRHKISLQTFVGEKSVIRERRRLGLKKIAKLVFSAGESEVNINISDIRLDIEKPYKNDFARLVKLDVGTGTSPLFKGFTALLPENFYRPERGYGYSPDAIIARSEDRRHPGNLFRDWTSLTGGGVDLDLPNGSYHVWMMLEDPGYWEYYPNFRTRKVLAEGRTVLDETQDAQQFLKKFYRHANDEDLPGDDTWTRYIRKRYKPLRFTVRVRDGQLNLRFRGEKNPYAFALSALLVYPEADRRKGDRFVREMWGRLEQQFNDEYRQISPPAPDYRELAGNALGGRLSVFRRSAAIDVHTGDYPKSPELVSGLSLALSRGETAPLTLSLRARKRLLVTGAVLELPGLKVTPFTVRNKLTRLTGDGSVYWNAPRLLDPLKASGKTPLRLEKAQTRRLWFDVEAPANSGITRVSGQLRLVFRTGEQLSLPVSVTVHPWRLPKPDIFHGYLGIAPKYPGTPWPEIAAKARREMQDALPLLARHGMNRFSGGLGGPVFKGYDKKGHVLLDFSNADRSMALLKGYGKGSVESYMGLSLEDLSVYRPEDWAARKYGKPYAAIIRDILKEIRRHGKAKGWRPVRHVLGDEPSGDAVRESASVARAFRAARTGTATSVFTSISDLSRDRDRLELAGLIDMIYLNHHSEAGIRAIRKKGSDCALYNRRNRYQRGIYLFRLRNLGCRGHIQFAFNSTHVDPWYDLDGREDDQVAVFTHPDGQLRPTLELKRYRMAITDYLYLLKLEKAIGKSRNRKPVQQARAWLDSILARMKVGHSQPHPWSPVQLDRVRATAAEHIGRLVVPG